jgi:hypothetical protein
MVLEEGSKQVLSCFGELNFILILFYRSSDALCAKFGTESEKA